MRGELTGDREVDRDTYKENLCTGVTSTAALKERKEKKNINLLLYIRNESTGGCWADSTGYKNFNSHKRPDFRSSSFLKESTSHRIQLS